MSDTAICKICGVPIEKIKYGGEDAWIHMLMPAKNHIPEPAVPKQSVQAVDLTIAQGSTSGCTATTTWAASGQAGAGPSRERVAQLAHEIETYYHDVDRARRNLPQEEVAKFDAKQPWCRSYFDVADDVLIPFLQQFFPVSAPASQPSAQVQQSEIDGLRKNEQPPNLDWDKVHSLLEPWQEVWEGDKAKYLASYPEWMVNAAAELFAHDICDVWAWNDYVAAATLIISRHWALSAPKVPAPLDLPIPTDMSRRDKTDEWDKAND